MIFERLLGVTVSQECCARAPANGSSANQIAKDIVTQARDAAARMGGAFRLRSQFHTCGWHGAPRGGERRQPAAHELLVSLTSHKSVCRNEGGHRISTAERDAAGAASAVALIGRHRRAADDDACTLQNTPR